MNKFLSIVFVISGFLCLVSCGSKDKKEPVTN